MNILAIETSSPSISVALGREGLITQDVISGASGGASGAVLVTLNRLLESENLSLGEIDALVVGIGPGSFTGVRTACAVALGLSLARALPLYPVCTLDALAATESADSVIAMLDARMGEVYWAAYRREEGRLVRESGPFCTPPAEVAFDASRRGRVCGAGFQAYRDAFAQAGAPEVELGNIGRLPTASDLIAWFGTHSDQISAVSADELVPLYVRDKVALTTRERIALKARA